MVKNYLSINDILERYGFSRTTFFNLRKSNDFPNPITPKHFSPRWSVSDLIGWESLNSNSNSMGEC